MDELTVDEAVKKVRRYIEQILPLPTCPQKVEQTKWKREQVLLKLSQVKPAVGPSEIK